MDKQGIKCAEFEIFCIIFGTLGALIEVDAAWRKNVD